MAADAANLQDVKSLSQPTSAKISEPPPRCMMPSDTCRPIPSVGPSIIYYIVVLPFAYVCS